MNLHPFASRRQRHRDESARQHRYDLEILEDSRLEKLKNKASADTTHGFTQKSVPTSISLKPKEPPVDALYPEEGSMPDEIRNPYENFPSTPRYERRKREWDEDRQRSRERREERRPRPPAYSREEPVEMRPPSYEERESRRGREYEGGDGVGLDDLEDEYRDLRDRDLRRRRTG